MIRTDAISGSILFVKVDWRSLVIVGIIGVITVPVAYKFVLHDYQRERVKTFLDPERDPRAVIEDIKAVNVLEGVNLYAGQILRIPN